MKIPSERVEGIHAIKLYPSAKRGKTESMDIPANNFPKMVDRAQVAKIFGVSLSTITRYEKTPEFPAHIVLPGGSIRYLLSDITSYINAMRG